MYFKIKKNLYFTYKFFWVKAYIILYASKILSTSSRLPLKASTTAGLFIIQSGVFIPSEIDSTLVVVSDHLLKMLIICALRCNFYNNSIIHFLLSQKNTVLFYENI